MYSKNIQNVWLFISPAIVSNCSNIQMGSSIVAYFIHIILMNPNHRRKKKLVSQWASRWNGSRKAFLFFLVIRLLCCQIQCYGYSKQRPSKKGRRENDPELILRPCAHPTTELFSSCLPRYDDHKVHDVPHVSQVTARMEDKALCQNLEAGLNRKDPQEIGLCGFLVQKK